MEAPQLALKVDVDTLRGTREGVPRLVRALHAAGAGATFLFSVGPDHTGRALRRVFKTGFLGKVARTSVTKHYGLKTLLYGTLLPGPDIGASCPEAMRSARSAGFETGLHAWDHVEWQDHVAGWSAERTKAEWRRGFERYAQIFGEPLRVHGAAGWQMNAHAFRLEALGGIDYASDTRGRHPFIPVIDGVPGRCPQLPTTLPTLDELLGRDGVDESNAHEPLLMLTARHPESRSHVFTLHAELEGLRLLPVLERLIEGWRRQGYALVAMRQLFSHLDVARLPAHPVEQGTVPGRAGTLMVQGPVSARQPDRDVRR